MMLSKLLYFSLVLFLTFCDGAKNETITLVNSLQNDTFSNETEVFNVTCSAKKVLAKDGSIQYQLENCDEPLNLVCVAKNESETSNTTSVQAQNDTLTTANTTLPTTSATNTTENISSLSPEPETTPPAYRPMLASYPQPAPSGTTVVFLLLTAMIVVIVLGLVCTGGRPIMECWDYINMYDERERTRLTTVAFQPFDAMD